MDFHGPKGMKNGTGPKNLQTSKLAGTLVGLSAINLDTFVHTYHKQRV